MRKNEEDWGTVFLRWGKAALLGGIAAFLISVVCLLVASVGISQGILAPELRYQITVASCVVGAFGGTALMVTQKEPGAGISTGVGVSCVQFLAMLALGLLIFDTASPGNGGVGLFLGSLCGGTSAGILLGRRKRGTKKKKHRGKR